MVGDEAAPLRSYLELAHPVDEGNLFLIYYFLNNFFYQYYYR